MIQPIAEVIREASDVTYVVVTDAEGIRMSHPDPERIGEEVSTDPSVPLSGDMWVGTQTRNPRGVVAGEDARSSPRTRPP